MRVLHVEDNPVDADLTRRALQRSEPGVEVIQASTLAQARDCLASEQGFDAALIDLNLPDGSGFDLLNWIRARAVPMAVVMLTGSGDQQAAVAALQAGADDYLTKTAGAPERLLATLLGAVERSRRVRAYRARPLRVLYAERSAYDIDLTRRHLAKAAPHVQLTVVGDAAEALRLLPPDSATPADFDVVLLDYRLPGLDALDVVKVLRTSRGLEIPIVMVTGQGTEAVAAQAIHLGVDDYIFKHPSYLHELPATIEKVHRQAELARERGSLRETSARLEHVLATAPVVLYSMRLDRDGARVTWVSSNIRPLMGFTEQQALAPGWWLQQVHPDDRQAALAQIAELPALGQVDFEYRLVDGHGQIRWIRDELRLVGSH